MAIGAVAGARCARHPEVAATGVCDRCGNFYCTDCAGRVDGTRTFCTGCASGIEYVAWEDRERLGSTRAFFLTIKRGILSPQEFAREIPSEGGIGAPTGFATIATTIGMGLTCLFFGAVMTIFFAAAQSGPGAMPNAIPLWAIPIGALFYWIVGIFSAIVMLFVGAGVLRLSTRLFGAPRGSYVAIFRVLAYSAGMNVGMGVPLLSTAVVVFQALHAIFGISAKCGVSTGRAAAIVFTPIGICLCLLGTGYVALLYLLFSLTGARA